MTLEKFLTLSKAILCLSIACSMLIVTPLVINHQLTSLRETVKIESTEYRKDTIALVDRRFDNLQGSVTNWLGTADKRIGSLENHSFLLADGLRGDFGNLQKDTFALANDLKKDTFNQLGGIAKNTNDQLTVTNQNVARLVDAYAAIPAVVGSRFNEQTDCKTNSICWQNLATDTMVNFRYTGRDVSAASKAFSTGFPSIINNVDKTTGNFTTITDNFKRLTTPHWYDRVLGYGLNAGILYSRFNPATNTVTVVTQAVSSQK